ncbi:MAG: hypothetical protein GX446_12575 [Chthonomonadales bacterium]|nr:hypothetical protein [Chthonomonadales bacterium]
MRLWGRGSRTNPESGQYDDGRAGGSLVALLMQEFDPDAAVRLIQRDWDPQTPEQKMALAIAMGMYRDLVPHGDACIEPLRRSEARHRWCAGVLMALAEIGTVPAITCLQDALRARWRSDDWDQHCTRLLSLPYGLRAMITELHARFDPRLGALLTAMGWKPGRPADEAALYIAQGNLEAAAECGPEATGPLIAAIEYKEDRYAVLEALSRMGTPEASEAVVSAVAEQWSRGVSRWTDFDMITRCGGTAIAPLIRLATSQPSRASMVVEMLQKIMEQPERVAAEDLQRVASLPDLRHQYMVKDDPRVYEQTLDCTDLRDRAQKALDARGA